MVVPASGFMTHQIVPHIKDIERRFLGLLEVYVGSMGLGVQWDPVNWER